MKTNIKSVEITGENPESRAAKLFKEPTHGSWDDRNDFLLRKRISEVQRKAYLKAIQDVKNKVITI